MSKFKFHLARDDDELVLDYDNETSELRLIEGNIVDLPMQSGDILVPQDTFKDWKPFYKMNAGKKELNRIKIQLGLKCNYSCEYCSQRFVPRNPDDSYTHSEEDESVTQISEFIHRFDTLDIEKDEEGKQKIHFEMWGGEPLLYFSKMKPIVEQLHTKFPDATFTVITNGSLLNEEIVNFLVEHDFGVSISHDAIGQKTRGADPLDDKNQKKWLLKLRNLLVPKNKFSVNTMIHRDNDSRAEVQRWIRNNFGMVNIGEGGTVDAYDEGGASMSWQSEEEHIGYRRKAFKEIMDKKIDGFDIIHNKMASFIESLKEQRPASSLFQKCGMESPNTMAVDLNGNVTTCQNVSAISKNPDGVSHHIGHMDDLAAVNIKTGTHWSDREDCPKCPVLHLCQGACLFLPPGSKEWELSCDNSYSDNVVWLAASLYELTGYVLYRIEDEMLPEYRKDVFGFALNDTTV